MVVGDRSAVSYTSGTIGSWPGGSGSGSALSQLGLLGPDFEAPVSNRSFVSISRNLGGLMFEISGVYRHTDFLPRRHNLIVRGHPRRQINMAVRCMQT